MDQSIIFSSSYYFLILSCLIGPSPSVNAQPRESPTASLSTSWLNTLSRETNSTRFPWKPILSRESSGISFGCGFYCNHNHSACSFAVTAWHGSEHKLQLVWSANRNNPVKLNATLRLTQDGDLVLADADGSVAWSTNTAWKSVSGLKLTGEGNLLLFDKNNRTVWQSFDHPTDTLLVGQKLFPGEKLIARISASDWSRGSYSLLVKQDIEDMLCAYTDSDPPQQYFASFLFDEPYVELKNGTISLNATSNAAQFMRLEPDGHLKVYKWGNMDWQVVADLFTTSIGDCGYPMACGKYGICSNGQCGCPEVIGSNRATIFRPMNFRQPQLGCPLVTPISCSHNRGHSLLRLKETRYFAATENFFLERHLEGENLDLEGCKKTCLNNCSCKALVFVYPLGDITGGCLLLSEVYSFTSSEGTFVSTSVFVKVQKSLNEESPSQSDHSQLSFRSLAIISGFSLGSFFVVFVVVVSFSFLCGENKELEDADELFLDQVPGMPTRFSYQDLKAITDNFRKKLGEGGFGGVFEGMLGNGTKVAVKCLHGLGHVKKSFLSEVETIGSIHHVNLVRLIGFAAEKSERLLVYEYMPNGSLERWIFNRLPEDTLGWLTRRRIILDIAKGLAYLHEDCRQKIYHLDIKPQNILLDEDFTAKVSDFGLAKLIEKDQSLVMTVLRGTPGYMAPEWLSSIITEKVDVYSFGVVMLEILCGRPNLDRSQLEEEDMHLLNLFKRKAEEGRLCEVVDKHNEEMQLHSKEVEELMLLAAWCLQLDFKRRPAMSLVVKALEGLVDIEQNLDYNFYIPKFLSIAEDVDQNGGNVGDATPLLPSILSGPR